eukprot:NODE_160_length_16633_cov_0.230132.p12 type:complete len:121 gc:universal NODE_160_length_16633_cov_0.230132:3625-3987(+)
MEIIRNQIRKITQKSLFIPVTYYISSPHPISNLRFLTFCPMRELTKNEKAYCDELSALYEFHHKFWLHHLRFLENLKYPKESLINKEYYIVASSTHLHIYYKEFWIKMSKIVWLRIKAFF